MENRVSLACAVGAVVVSSLAGQGMGADAFDSYGRSYRPFATPPVGDGSFSVAGDALPDGRLLMVTGNSVFLESGVGTGVFSEVALLDAGETGGSTDPAFLRVSPSGGRVAIGVGFGKPVAVFDTAALGTPGSPTVLTSGSAADYFDVGHFGAAWYDDRSLALTAGEFGSPSFVSLLDTASSPDSPVNEVVVREIQGASAGVAFDGAGRLYTANGFALGGGSETGDIRAFAPSEWMAGAAFETGGVLIGEVLSGGSLTFDLDGNLFVGGGDFDEFDAGYLGVIEAGAIGAALDGFGPIDVNDPEQLRRLDPRGDGFGYFGAAFNAATGELYVTDGETWYATVPAPGTLAAALFAAAVRGRRRRG